ncbi:ABC-type protease exporter membrane fusion protein (MFP) family component PrtE/AprE [Photobacterium aphoticum]|uniref:ABC-type protease exporter membrane fusion protein (MFP) family component PrtE/AprE n=1 Tax=Photobacterium aphoticum TaxID=754436 RepID=A0A090RMX1_9GAMM|nr:ABC-type protease exporter membrane fusion protein (MFP) family component PrtE/AprE [Photobacterium aphoticum]
MKKQSRSLASNHLDFIDDKTAALLLNTPKSARIILWTIVFFFISAVIWASFAQLDQVTVGQGKVIPSSQLQVVQNLEGGIVEKVLIKVGQHVDKGQKLILLDDTLFQSDYQERNLALAAAKADVARLNALHETVHVDKEKAENNWQKSVVISPQAIVFEPEFLHNHPKLVQRQKIIISMKSLILKTSFQ